MKTNPLCREDRRRGVALIVVLGFLTIMIMMALAFLTQARVERLVSDSSLEGMRTRQMAQTAIAAAMQDYLNALKTVSPADAVHDIFLSGDKPGTLNFYYSGEVLGDDRLLTGKVEDWLLDSQLDAALTGGTNVSDLAGNAEWIWVRQQPGARSRILGRYAYACFDSSGLLDANLLGTTYGDDVPQYGDTTNRTNVRKMVYEALSQSSGGANQLKLNLYQRLWKGFDTPAALLNLTDGDWNDGRNSGPNRWIGADMDETPVGSVSPANLAAYSYAVLHREDGSGHAKIQATAASIGNEADFATLAEGNKTDVLKALQDYENPNPVPNGVNYPSVKNVPMFNEIGAWAELNESGTVPGPGGSSLYDLELHLQIEFWYPFPSKNNATAASYTMSIPTIGAGPAESGAEDIWIRLYGVSGGSFITTIEKESSTAIPAGSLTVQAKFNNNTPYVEEIVYTIHLVNNTGSNLPPAMSVGIYNVSINHPLVLRSGGSPVDATPDTSLTLMSEQDPLVGNVPGPGAAQISSGVKDPRLNHDDDAWSEPGIYTPSFGSINPFAEAAADAVQGTTGIAPGKYFYCRNGPIQRPGELGYLSTGQAWETLDIFSDPGIRLMNRMVCDEDVFNVLTKNQAYYTNGTINPYTRRPNVLNAAFYGLDVREVPNINGTPAGEEILNGSELTETVKAMMLEPVKNGYGGWGKILASKNLPTALNRNIRIAMLNNTWGLFNESDRLFVVAVIAQSIKEGPDAAGLGNWNASEDIITGERRAVALCWMDGSADVGGETLTQEMNIIMFQDLNE